jgi:phospholipid/cholesterol/gamma-HCH transport system substrate-binding protein
VGNLQNASKDLARAAPRLPQIAQNVEGGTTNLGPLLSQTQVSLQELEKLLVQLRGLWLLGGSGPPPPEPRRLPSAEVRP